MATATRPSPATPLQRLLTLLKPERAAVGRVYFYAAVAGVLGLSVPLGVQAIIGLISGGLLLQPVAILIALVVLGTFAAGAVQVVQLGEVERIQERLFARWALELSQRLPRADLEALAGTDLPELTNRFFEVITIQKSLGKLLTESVAALLSIVAGLALLTFYHPYLSLFGATLLTVLAATLWITGKRGMQTSLAESEAKYRVAHWLQELARHVNSFRLTGDALLPVTRMDRDVDDYLAHRQAHFRVLVRQSLAVVLMKTLVTGGLLVIGAALVVNRSISLGQFVASELVIVTVLAGVEKLIFSLSTVYDALTAAEKSSHLRELPTLRDGTRAPATEPSPWSDCDAQGMSIRATGLVYRYAAHGTRERRDVLHIDSLVIEPGERVALVGSEGAGASTLLRLLAGLHTTFDGALVMGGTSLRDLRSADVRAHVSLVEADGRLFDGTLSDNITVGRTATASDVAHALELAGLDAFVHGLPEGMRTMVGGSGMHVPSYVARKVLLARAIVNKPRLLLLDEFFHHLEPTAKSPIVKRLTDRRAGWTILAASHDPTFLVACDRVLLLDGGQVTAEGSYDAMQSRLRSSGLLRTEPRMRDHASASSGAEDA